MKIFDEVNLYKNEVIENAYTELSNDEINKYASEHIVVFLVWLNKNNLLKTKQQDIRDYLLNELNGIFTSDIILEDKLLFVCEYYPKFFNDYKNILIKQFKELPFEVEINDSILNVLLETIDINYKTFNGESTNLIKGISLLKTNPIEGVKFLLLEDSTESLYELGCYYESISDFEPAMLFYENSNIEQGIVKLSNLLFEGKGCFKDEEKAFNIIEEFTSIEALTQKCKMYLYGIKYKDYNKAFNLLKEINNKDLLGVCYLYGYGTSIDIKKGLELIKDNKLELGIYYSSNDIDKAKEIFLKGFNEQCDNYLSYGYNYVKIASKEIESWYYTDPKVDELKSIMSTLQKNNYMYSFLPIDTIPNKFFCNSNNKRAEFYDVEAYLLETKYFDKDISLLLYKKLINNNCYLANLYLGKEYCLGNIVPYNEEEAISNFKIAIENNISGAQEEYDNIINNSPLKKLLTELKQYEDKNDTYRACDCYFKLAKLGLVEYKYLAGYNGLFRDDNRSDTTESKKYLLEAADENHPLACCYQGILYAQGFSTEERKKQMYGRHLYEINFDSAKRYLLVAAKEGNTLAKQYLKAIKIKEMGE